MIEWRETTWGDEISLEYGKAIRGYQNAVAPYRVFGTNGPVGYTDTPLADGPGVILGRKGAYRGVHFSRDPFFVIDTAYYVKPKSTDLDMRWIYYAMIQYKIGEIDDGSPIPSTTRAAVYVRDLIVPPLSEQRSIASVLGALDDKIKLNQEMNETLEAAALALFQDWFVNFGPTRAKSEGRPQYLSAHVWDLFPDALDDDGVPVGWERRTLGSAVEILDSKRVPLSKKQRQERHGEYRYFGATGVVDHVDEYLFDGVHVLLGEDGSVVRNDGTPFVQYVWGQFWVNNHAHVLRGQSVSNEFLYCLLSGMEISPYVTGAVQAKLNQGNLKRMPFVCPGADVLEKFDDLASPLFARVRENSYEAETLASIRDVLLPRLMSGEIRIKDAEKAVEAVA